MTKKGWIKWRGSAAREVLLNDMEYGGWLYDAEDDEEPLDVFNVYKKQHGGYENVCFEQFEALYKDYRKKSLKHRGELCKGEIEWMERDRKLYPRQTRNDRGQLLFDMDSAAKEQLKEDIKQGLHKQMAPSDL